MTRNITGALILLTIVMSCNKKSPTKNEIDTLTDIDGNAYQTIVIGNQRWMAENLKVTHFRDGSAIPKVTDNTEWSNLNTAGYCAHNNDEANVPNYGYLYNAFAVNDVRNIAPEGWRVATDEDWKELELYLGMSQDQVDRTDYRGGDVGGKLKEAGFDFWGNPNVGATNESGFSARPGSYRYESGNFHPMIPTGFGLFWSATPTGSNSNWMRLLSSDEAMIYRYFRTKTCGMTVRLVKDN
ncbi:fibrobacter succinogenes major paralogous domain-containing protein [Candidatus Dojkabacteria bacterium]|nr:fibrobacter succinogenes major paralogous domain-containing protein [Candidatus Dojkabacteria bacterium]